MRHTRTHPSLGMTMTFWTFSCVTPPNISNDDDCLTHR